jgi:anti-sigma B factor antagonist
MNAPSAQIGEPALEPLELSHREDGRGRQVVAVKGEIDVATSPALRDDLYAIIDGGAREVVVDLSELGFIDSSGLGVLVAALKHMRERDGQLVLAGLQQPALRVFEITDLTTLFTLEPGVS